jgi:hypothetical protein
MRVLGNQLIEQYKSPVVPLEKVIADFLPHLNLATANKKASVQDLPFLLSKRINQRAPYMVYVSHLAKWLQPHIDVSNSDWSKMHNQ